MKVIILNGAKQSLMYFPTMKKTMCNIRRRYKKNLKISDLDRHHFFVLKFKTSDQKTCKDSKVNVTENKLTLLVFHCMETLCGREGERSEEEQLCSKTKPNKSRKGFYMIFALESNNKG